MLRALSLALVLALLVPSTAGAKLNKAIAGPVELNGEPAFPAYADLGVSLWQATLTWKAIAPAKPLDPRDPDDPGYDWPAELNEAVSDAADRHIRVVLTLTGAPEWAGKRPSAFADFTTAAARRYPAVHLWSVWDAPSRSLRAKAYLGYLNAAYQRLKAASRRNLVIGGNSASKGGVAPQRWIRSLRRAHMDFYGHDPSANRRLDITALVKRLNAALDRRVPLYLGGYTIPTSPQAPFHVSQATQAAWLRTALRDARGAPNLFALGYDGLADDDRLGGGLLDPDGSERPAYAAFKRG